jgi:bifunctional polynucleotide phosphatase/kinase
VPFRIFAASADDEYRKPMLGMLHALEDIYTSENVEMGKPHRRTEVSVADVNNPSADMAESYFVGDAAGRPNDHSGTDRKWAVNAGLKFYTPEV